MHVFDITVTTRINRLHDSCFENYITSIAEKLQNEYAFYWNCLLLKHNCLTFRCPKFHIYIKVHVKNLNSVTYLETKWRLRYIHIISKYLKIIKINEI